MGRHLGWLLVLGCGWASSAWAKAPEPAPAQGPVDAASARALIERFGASSNPFHPAPAPVAAIAPLSSQAWASLEEGVSWIGGTEPETPPSYPEEEPASAVDLSATKTEAELLALLAEASPMYAEYPRILAALALEDPAGGRRRILEHLRTNTQDPSENLRAWSPAMSSLAWIDPAPLDRAMLDAIACVIVRDPGHWFLYAYLAQASRARGRPEELGGVAERLPAPLAATLRHYEWLMSRTTADLEADMRALGIPFEGTLTAEARAEIDGVSHWTPMDRLRDHAEIYEYVYVADGASALRDVYRWLWLGATAVAPVTLKDVRFGVVWPDEGEPVTLVLERGDQRWRAEVSSENADYGAATALFDQVVPAGQAARFQLAVARRSERTGLMFGDPAGLPLLAGLYRLDEPDFNLMQPLAAAQDRACPTSPR